MTRLDVSDLVLDFSTASGTVRALDGASFAVHESETVGIVGESGSGKTTLGLSIGQLLPRSALHRSGDLRLDGRSVFKMTDSELRRLRRERLAFVFQNPMSALDPTMRIGRQVSDALGGTAATSLVDSELRRVGLNDTERIARAYPHMLSGGMAQRVAIAMAFARRPEIVVADEPTAAIDAAIRQRILQLILQLGAETGATVLLLTHDLRSVADRCGRVAVMYAGRVVEAGPTDDVFTRPIHPYTQALLRSAIGTERIGQRTTPIGGLPPVLTDASTGCAFSPRCSWAIEQCATVRPVPTAVDGRTVLCHRSDETLTVTRLG